MRPARAGRGRLTDAEVRNAVAPADGTTLKLSDGGSMYLFLRDKTRSWRLDYGFAGKRRTAVLGSHHKMGLKAARAAAQAVRDQLAAGLDPAVERQRIADEAVNAARRAREERLAAERGERERKKAEVAARKADALTLARAARAYHERIEQKFRNPKHRAQWINSLEQHVPAALWNRSLRDIRSADLIDALADITRAVPETGARVQQRLAVVFEDAVVRELVERDPMVGVRRRVMELIGKRAKGHHAMLPYVEIPTLMKRLAETEGMAARALQWTILTAARSGETFGMTWSEVDLDAGLWIVPGERMKSGESHTVYLSAEAIEVLRRVAPDGAQRPEGFVFWSSWGPRGRAKDAAVTPGRYPLSNMGMEMVLGRLKLRDRATVHGMRAAFSTWAAERTQYRSDAVEACLAHRESDRVKAAYNRAQFADDRRALLCAWGVFVTSRADGANVIDIATAKAA